MTTRLRWGILGTGKVAHLFADGPAAVEGAEIRVVAFRSEERGTAFAREFSVSKRHSSYEALVEQKDIDVVYVATPHCDHLSNTLMCLDGGKHVLCEIPGSQYPTSKGNDRFCSSEGVLFNGSHVDAYPPGDAEVE